MTETTQYVSTEDAINAALDENPADQVARSMLADYYEEQNDPRAEGYKVLAHFDRAPYRPYDRPDDQAYYNFLSWTDNNFPTLNVRGKAVDKIDRSALPIEWVLADERNEQAIYDESRWTRDFVTRRECEDFVARLWLLLDKETQDRIKTEWKVPESKK